MFIKTVVASKLREKMAYYFELVKGSQVVQILHKGGDVKVLMTQDHYLNLLSRIALYEKVEKQETVAPKTIEDLEAIVLKKFTGFEEEKVLTDGDSNLGKNSTTKTY
jgi:hypothetical protein